MPLVYLLRGVTMSEVRVSIQLCTKPIVAALQAAEDAYSAGELSAQDIQQVLDMGSGIVLVDRVNCATCRAKRTFAIQPGEKLLPLVRARLANQIDPGVCGWSEFHGGNSSQSEGMQ